jgi:methyl-accepting chemotaxis protein
MNKIIFKVAIPIILAGFFVIIIFIALNYGSLSKEVYFVFIALSIYVFLFGFATGQSFSSPVKKLLKRATELSQGDLKTRVYLETKDEFGELSKIFNKIAQDLEESKQAGSRAEESIDIKVKAKTQALEETIVALEQKVKNRTLELDKVIKEIEKQRDEVKNKDGEIAELKVKIEEAKKVIIPDVVEKPKKVSVRKNKIGIQGVAESKVKSEPIVDEKLNI